jgi:hypothetical protein
MIDWSVFDKHDPLECRCHCGLLFLSHVKAIPGVGIVVQNPCPSCGSETVRSASGSETMRLRASDKGEVKL